MDAKEASDLGTTQNAEVAATEKEIESVAEVENETEVQHEPEPEPESQIDEAGIENAAIDKELNEGCEDDVPDDTLSLDLDGDDLFNDVEDVTKR